MPRSRLTTVLDEDNKIISMKLVGDLPGSQMVTAIVQAYGAIGTSWQYHHLVDLRRYEGVILSTDIEEWGRLTAEISQMREGVVKVAIVTSDPLAVARLSATRGHFPKTQIDLFPNFDSALDWLKKAE
jgi:hypothetical protein